MARVIRLHEATSCAQCAKPIFPRHLATKAEGGTDPGTYCPTCLPIPDMDPETEVLRSPADATPSEWPLLMAIDHATAMVGWKEHPNHPPRISLPTLLQASAMRQSHKSPAGYRERDARDAEVAERDLICLQSLAAKHLIEFHTERFSNGGTAYYVSITEKGSLLVGLHLSNLGNS